MEPTPFTFHVALLLPHLQLLTLPNETVQNLLRLFIVKFQNGVFVLKISNLDVLDSCVALQLQEKLILAAYIIETRLNLKHAIKAFVCDNPNSVVVVEEHNSRSNLP